MLAYLHSLTKHPPTHSTQAWWKQSESVVVVDQRTTTYRFSTPFSPPITWLVKASEGTPEAKLEMTYGDGGFPYDQGRGGGHGNYSGRMIVVAGNTSIIERAGDNRFSTLYDQRTHLEEQPWWTQTCSQGSLCTEEYAAEQVAAASPPQVGEQSTNVESDHTCAVCGSASATRCSRCKMRWYCGRGCQKRDWKEHKSVCGKP